MLACLLSLCVSRGETQSKPSLSAQRSRYKTVLKKRIKAPYSFLALKAPHSEEVEEGFDDPPKGLSAVTYPSDGNSLKAWISVPKSSGKHSAILVAHSGFQLDKQFVAQTVALLREDYVVFYPSWRGENDNPGNFELCYGEVNDALAAVRYLKGLESVDPEHLYVIGCGTGGTIAMLLAEMTAEVKDVACIGGNPLMSNWLDAPVLPFDRTVKAEVNLRSPALFVGDLQVPLALYYADTDGNYILPASDMELQAKKLGKKLSLRILESTAHDQAIVKALPMVLKFLRRP